MRPDSLFLGRGFRLPGAQQVAITLLLVAALPGAPAQKFAQPTREELAMTSDPKAPGASAVYLYREDDTDNRNHFRSVYARIKVLTEKGKDWATVEVPSRRAWTRRRPSKVGPFTRMAL